MIEHNINISTDDGQMATFITHPVSGGPYPVVLFLIDAPGKREELHDMARRISATGYYVMLSNLYYRDTPSFMVHREDPASSEHMFSLMANLNNRIVAQDAAAMVAHAEGDALADANRVGVPGFAEIKVSCDDHEGGHPVLFQQWDASAKSWSVVSDWVPTMRDVVRPMMEADAAKYAAENNITPRDCG